MMKTTLTQSVTTAVGCVIVATATRAAIVTPNFVHDVREPELMHRASSRRDPLAHRTTPADICRLVASKVNYRKDLIPEDEWLGADETLARGAGDCEDFAQAVRTLCTRKGFKADIYVLRDKTTRKAHAITVGTWHGTLWFSSNGSYREVASMDDSAQAVAREMGWWVKGVTIKKSTGNSARHSSEPPPTAAFAAEGLFDSVHDGRLADGDGGPSLKMRPLPRNAFPDWR